MANFLAPIAGGLARGISQGFNMQRQQALEQAYLKIAQEREQRLAALMESQERARQAQQAELMARHEKEQFTSPLDAMLHSNPELGYQLSPGYGAAEQFQSAPPVAGEEENSPIARPDFYRMRNQAIREAAERATGIRKEKEAFELEKRDAAFDASIQRALGMKDAQTREQLKRSLGTRLLNRDLSLPEGATVDSIVDNLMAGDASALPVRTLKNKDAEAVTSFDAIEAELNNIEQLKGDVDTGTGMEAITAPLRWLGIEPVKRKALRANLTAIISQWVKQQTGVQYGFRELRWLSEAAPKMTDNDAQFLKTLEEFRRRVKVVKEHRLRALAAGNYDVNALDIPELGGAPENIKPDNLGVHPVPPPGPAAGPAPLKTLRWVE